MSEIDLQQQMVEAAKERSDIAKALLAIQSTLDKLDPTMARMESVLSSRKPTVNARSAGRPGVDEAVGKLQSDIGDVWAQLTKIAHNTAPAPSDKPQVAPKADLTEAMSRVTETPLVVEEVPQLTTAQADASPVPVLPLFFVLELEPPTPTWCSTECSDDDINKVTPADLGIKILVDNLMPFDPGRKLESDVTFHTLQLRVGRVDIRLRQYGLTSHSNMVIPCFQVWPPPELEILDCHTKGGAGDWNHRLVIVGTIVLHPLELLGSNHQFKGKRNTHYSVGDIPVGVASEQNARACYSLMPSDQEGRITCNHAMVDQAMRLCSSRLHALLYWILHLAGDEVTILQFPGTRREKQYNRLVWQHCSSKGIFSAASHVISTSTSASCLLRGSSYCFYPGSEMLGGNTINASINCALLVDRDASFLFLRSFCSGSVLLIFPQFNWQIAWPPSSRGVDFRNDMCKHCGNGSIQNSKGFSEYLGFEFTPLMVWKIAWVLCSVGTVVAYSSPCTFFARLNGGPVMGQPSALGCTSLFGKQNFKEGGVSCLWPSSSIKSACATSTTSTSSKFVPATTTTSMAQEYSTLIKSTSTMATTMKATTITLAAPWDPGRNSSASAWGQAEFQGGRNVMGIIHLALEGAQGRPTRPKLGVVT